MSSTKSLKVRRQKNNYCYTGNFSTVSLIQFNFLFIVTLNNVDDIQHEFYVWY